MLEEDGIKEDEGMPAVSQAQKKLMGVALAIKRKKIPRSYSREASRMADEMTEAQLEEFASRVKRKAIKKVH